MIFSSRPKSFAHSVRPRDEQAATLIRSIMDEYPLDRGDADELMAFASMEKDKWIPVDYQQIWHLQETEQIFVFSHEIV